MCKGASVTLTANKRLAGYLLQQFEEEQKALGHLAWVTPHILPLSTWLRTTFQANRQQPLALLSPSQSLLIWENIIRDSGFEGILQLSSTAELAQQTWQLCQHWKIKLHQTDPTFFQWAEKFQDYCHQNYLIDDASLLGAVTELIQSGHIELPSSMCFSGFDNHSLQLTELIEVIQSKTVFKTLSLPAPSTKNYMTSVANEEHEMFIAARWLKQKTVENPQGKVACVVPDLANVRQKILTVFTEVFGEHHVDISAGQSLTEYPIIKTAFRLLQLIDDNLDFHFMSTILRSPYVKGSEEEGVLRAKLDAQLREHCELYPDFNTLFQNTDCEIWASCWDAFLSAKNTFNNEQKPSVWAEKFNKLLKLFDWPACEELTEIEFACLERFDLLLNEFSQLDKVSEKISADEALRVLENLAKKTVFQLPMPNANVQIIGLLESAGLNFDAMWVMGLDNESFPDPIQPNPFIPVDLQRKLNMPKASPKHELEYAKNVLTRLKNSAEEVIFSHSEFLEDKPLQATTLLKDLPQISIEQLSLCAFKKLTETLFEQRKLENFEDHGAPPVKHDENIRGGAYILKAQAICPFKAFAEIRLNATGLESPGLGLDAADRGTMVHEVLAHFWGDVSNSMRLKGLSNDELDEKIIQAIDQTLFHGDSRVRGNDVLVHLEKQRLKTVIKDWLNYEKTRDDFSVVGIEKSTTVTIGDLELHCRIDRIDKLTDGSHVIIDYKTGKTTPNSWFGERPDDPQLPLYCISSDLPLSALVFAECRANSQQFKGISTKEKVLPDVKVANKYGESWENIISDWRVNLTELANDFLSGVADVDPKHPLLSCQYCELDALCRIR